MRPRALHALSGRCTPRRWRSCSARGADAPREPQVRTPAGLLGRTYQLSQKRTETSNQTEGPERCPLSARLARRRQVWQHSAAAAAPACTARRSGGAKVGGACARPRSVEASMFPAAGAHHPASRHALSGAPRWRRCTPAQVPWPTRCGAWRTRRSSAPPGRAAQEMTHASTGSLADTMRSVLHAACSAPGAARVSKL